MSELEISMFIHISEIVHNESRPFSYLDCLHFKVNGKPFYATHGTIRNIFSKFVKENKIELAYSSKPAFYSLPGIKFGKNKLMTDTHTGDKDSQLKNHPLYGIMESIVLDERAIHNIHFSVKINGIYGIATKDLDLKQCYSENHKGFSFSYYDIDKFSITLTINRTDSVIVIVGCTDDPVTLDYEGLNRLTNALSKIEERLKNIVKSQLEIPTYKQWVIKLWHLGRDSLTEYSKDMFHCTLQLAEKIILRIYTKEIANGKNRIRLEVQNSPNINIGNLQKKILDKL